MIGRLPRGRLQVPRLKSYERLGAVITGASSGIGRILALRLAERGAHIALVARREAELEAVAGEIRRLCPGGPDPLILPCDVGVAGQVAAAAERAIAGLGTVDLLVNNAGYGHHRRFLDWDLADMERMMRVNYLGALYWTKALLPKMIERGSGWLVFMASVAGKIGTPEEAAYSASKFAMVGLAEALSLEVEDAGVHVLTVCPGVIRTPFFDQEALARMPPVARRSMVDPEDLVDAILSALARGKHEITYPRAIAAAYAVRGLAPGFMRRQVKRTTLGALAREQRRSSKHRQGNDD
ncbi:MAG: SDR family NAD(P)-dependent oxidoreductase [Myxococcales bacterium]|nr:MAG: SDR family NAD(P)-dependent oxidoreductase [Myxococcales bacterium]